MNPIPQVREYEKELIKAALRSTNGDVTKASVILEVSRQALSYIIESKYPELLTERSPIKKRKKQ